ncbi:hypothetical protein J6590_094145 [Homalodisca vitripennis]|nr:hypothetical protein J6590_094145 [Homalodisca vitripennis]
MEKQAFRGHWLLSWMPARLPKSVPVLAPQKAFLKATLDFLRNVFLMPRLRFLLPQRPPTACWRPGAARQRPLPSLRRLRKLRNRTKNFADNSDADPSYLPDQPSTTNGKRARLIPDKHLGTSRSHLETDDSDSDDPEINVDES